MLQYGPQCLSTWTKGSHSCQYHVTGVLFLFFFLYFDGYTNVVCMNEWMSCFADRQKHMEAMDNDLII